MALADSCPSEQTRASASGPALEPLRALPPAAVVHQGERRGSPRPCALSGKRPGWWPKDSADRSVSPETARGDRRAGGQALPGTRWPPSCLCSPRSTHVRNQGLWTRLLPACLSPETRPHLPGPHKPTQSPGVELRRRPPLDRMTPCALPRPCSPLLSLLSPVVGTKPGTPLPPLRATPANSPATLTQFLRGLGKAAHLPTFLPREELSWLPGSRHGAPRPGLAPRLLLLPERQAPSLRPRA